MKSNYTVVPEWSFQEIFPRELRLFFSNSRQKCRVEIKAGNLLFIIQPDGKQLAFSVENIQQRGEYDELKFTIKQENSNPGWPPTAVMTLTKTQDLKYSGVIIGEGLHEEIELSALAE